eukprot:8111415-Karenia_brevis.AAC.1
MLKWLLILHDVLLRLPPRGGRRGRSAVAHRFAAWASGDYAAVLRWWQHDRAAARHPRHSSMEASEQQVIKRVIGLLSTGHVSRAVRMLTSSGLGDLSDERVVAQLRAKHPTRKEQLGELEEGAPPPPRLQVSVSIALADLDEMAAPGISGFRNSYLKRLNGSFADQRASEAVELLDKFAEAYVNVDLPAWFYIVFSSVRLVAPVKPTDLQREVPDVRPLGLGECLRRLIHSALVAENRDGFQEFFWPQQVAVGTPSGIS